MRILLIAGGWSPERDVSLAGARGIASALEARGHTVSRLDPADALDQVLDEAPKHDFAFINLHGCPGEDGLIQAMLERVGCPYQGASPAGSFLALNKAVTKQFLRRAGLPTQDWVLLTARPEDGWEPGFAYPLFIKSNTGGSSLGMERVATPVDLPAALDRLFARGGEYLVEPAFAGVELSCGVLGIPGGGEEALPPIMIRPKALGSEFFDYAAKYAPGGAEEICPAPIPTETIEQIQQIALTTHRALGLSGCSRTDVLLADDGSLTVLEVNTLPGMTPTSLLPQEAAAVGIDFPTLLERLITLGLERKGC